MGIRVAVGQMDSVVGGFEANIQKISRFYEQACASGARVLLTPELSVCGYPPGDLLERPDFLASCEKALKHLASLTIHQNCALLVGHVVPNARHYGKALQNQVTIFEKGKAVFSQGKMLLPNYDVFDEPRYFESSPSSSVWVCDGYHIVFGICEDLWAQQKQMGRVLYPTDPVDNWLKQQPPIDLICSLSASPYELGKFGLRETIHQELAKKVGVPLIYVNQVGAVDELLFEGGSFVVDGQGQLIGRMPFFEKTIDFVLLKKDSVCVEKFPYTAYSGRTEVQNQEIGLLAEALIVGIRTYFERTGFQKALLGLSGGIDSAVVATLAVQALGSNQVIGIAMPGPYSSMHSITDAEELALRLKLRFEVHPIQSLFLLASQEWSRGRHELASLALENLQSRLRGLLLMTLANHESALVLATGNKSEFSMGYCTMYGDMNGALAPIGDLFKTKVYALARHLNATLGDPIPLNSLIKPPSAELRPDQTDQDTLPPYELLDAILSDWIEKQTPLETLERRYRAQLHDILGLLRKVDMQEYKRRQAPPVLRVSSKAFGIGRRIPIAKQVIEV